MFGALDLFFLPYLSVELFIRVTRNRVLGLFWALRVLIANLFFFFFLFSFSFFAVLGFQHFLCYICKEYVEDLAKIPKSFLQVSSLRMSSTEPCFRATL